MDTNDKTITISGVGFEPDLVEIRPRVTDVATTEAMLMPTRTGKSLAAMTARLGMFSIVGIDYAQVEERVMRDLHENPVFVDEYHSVRTGRFPKFDTYDKIVDTADLEPQTPRERYKSSFANKNGQKWSKKHGG